MKLQDFQNRKDEPFNKTRGTVKRVIALGGKLTTLWVILKGALVITNPGGGAAGTPNYPDLPMTGLIQRIRVRATKAANSRYPDGVIRDYSPRTILRRAQQLRGKLVGPLVTATTAALQTSVNAGAAGTVNFYLAFPIHFAQPDLRWPALTALPLDLDTNNNPIAYKSVVVEIDCGDRDTCFTGNTMTWDYSGLSFDFMDERDSFDGDTLVVFETEHEMMIGGASKRYEDRGMPTEGSLMDLLVLSQTGGGAAATLADTIVNGVQLEGDNLSLQLNARDIRQNMIDKRVYDSAETLTGIFHIPFCDDGTIRKHVPLSGFEMKWDIANPSGANADSLLVSPRRLLSPVNYTPPQRRQKSA